MSENMYHINSIEGMISTVIGRIDEINPRYQKEVIAKQQAIKDMTDFQEGSLFTLRTLFEGDNNG